MTLMLLPGSSQIVPQLQETEPVAEVASVEKVPVADQLGEVIDVHARAALKEGSTEFHLRLDPPELGTIHVHLTADAEGITARLIVTNESTRILIEGHLSDLRQRLETAFASFTGQQWWHGHGRGQQQRNDGHQTWFVDPDEEMTNRTPISSATKRIDVRV